MAAAVTTVAVKSVPPPEPRSPTRPPLPPSPLPHNMASAADAATLRRPVRRRGAREVSSRYMSTPMPPSPRAFHDENSRPTPRRANSPSTAVAFLPPTPTANAPSFRKRHVVKLFDEISDQRVGAPIPHTRPSTPTLTVPARQNRRMGTPRPATPGRLQPVDACSENSDTESTCSASSQGGGGAFCESPPLLGSRTHSRQQQSVSDVRSSMPEARKTGTVKQVKCDANEEMNPLCCRSLNSALSSLGGQLGVGKVATKPTSASLKPPQPPAGPSKNSVGAKTVKKGSGLSEDIHELRLLYNRDIQWRFVDAKSRETAKLWESMALRSEYDVLVKTLVLRESVARRRAELENRRRQERLLSVLQFQMPMLDKWTDYGEEHSSSISGMTTALQNAALRVPLVENAQANFKELKEVLSSAVRLMEPLTPYVQSFQPKAEGIQDIASSLAQVVNTERVLIEECGNLLSYAHMLQVQESSLRSLLLQLKQTQGSHVDERINKTVATDSLKPKNEEYDEQAQLEVCSIDHTVVSN